MRDLTMKMSPVLAAVTAAVLLGFAGHAVAAAPLSRWVPTWYAAPEPNGWAPAELKDLTLRQIVHVTAGGTAVRLRFSNKYGAAPLRIDAVAVAGRAMGADKGAALMPGSSHAVTFQGKSDVTIAAGAQVLSDPVAFEVAPASDLAVSLYVAGPVMTGTMHVVQRNAAYFAQGNQIAAETLTAPLAAPVSGQSWLWLSEVEVGGSKAKKTVVAFGDSITDGVGPAADSNASWPDVLAQRFRDKHIRLSLTNAGISGNRLLHDGMWSAFGAAAVARFDTDVLAQPNVDSVVVALGINDIGHAGGDAPADQFVSAAQMEDALGQLAERAHDNGIKIFVATLMPFRETVFKGYYTDAKEAIRQEVNAWIRGQTVFDGVADLDKALDDPAAPGHLLPAYDSGDHLHPSAAGDKAIADAIPLSWFK